MSRCREKDIHGFNFYRVHRGGGKPTLANNKNNNNSRRSPRVIHDRLYDWNNVERLKDLMWKHGIYIDQRFGPTQALVARRDFCGIRSICLSNVKVQEDFSSMDVPLLQVQHLQDDHYKHNTTSLDIALSGLVIFKF